MSPRSWLRTRALIRNGAGRLGLSGSSAKGRGINSRTGEWNRIIRGLDPRRQHKRIVIYIPAVALGLAFDTINGEFAEGHLLPIFGPHLRRFVGIPRHSNSTD